MTVSLIKGQKADVTKGKPDLHSIIVGMGWNSGASIDIDFSAFLLGAGGKVTQDEDLIFYGNPAGGGSSVRLSTSEKRWGGSDKEQVTLEHRAIPQQYERIAFTLTIYDADARRQSFSQVDGTYIRIMDAATGAELLRFELGQSGSVETAIVVGELYRYNNEWKFNAIGSGYTGGLGALCDSFGIEVKDDASSASSKPQPGQPPAPPVPQADAPPPAPPVRQEASPPPQPVQLQKIELKKRGDTINLQKNSGSLGELLINLNWNQKKSSGFFGSKRIDLDLGCLFEMKDGQKAVIQALGNAFGSLRNPPYIALDGDDRTGSVSTGENLRINGSHISEIKRILVFAFIYEGVSKWTEADGVVTIKQSHGPDIVIRLDEPDNRKRMCGIAMITNVRDETFSVEKLVHYVEGHRQLDQAYNWGLKWVAGSK
ncbi:TerD family protein [Paenibacillus sp. SYP-B4298]|uniref:TerD family protein n=1 Tax=Paenibacillus sp. SYP-B4298 TaxID=2996034 RepID=UPI0022DD8F7E|nr:TerD family protein [Paenibacillus sp. SYP-B4298]